MTHTDTSILKPDSAEFTAAGQHLLIDLWTDQHLDDVDYIEKILKECVDACHATLLHIHVHHFSPQMGISGVAVLAESHISVHTWPEQNYAAFDVFMCGNTHPQNAVRTLKKAFAPTHCKIQKIQRSSAIKN